MIYENIFLSHKLLLSNTASCLLRDAILLYVIIQTENSV